MTVAITGGSGFIGTHLVKALLRDGNKRIRILSRSASEQMHSPYPAGVEVVRGDLCDLASLKEFLVSGCTVINLVYLSKDDEKKNLLAMKNLLAACEAVSVARLIHCSTADVAGRTSQQPVIEASPCRPVTVYARIKLKLEAAILAATHREYEAVILRPTAVFGPGGQNLRKLAHDLSSGSRWQNAVKACLFGKRSMNLVCVDNVIAAITFLVDIPKALDGQIFIVSDDDAPTNNYASVEWALMRELGVGTGRRRRVFLPSWVLSLILRFLGKNNIDPFRIYDSGKLRSLGFRRPVAFDEGLSDYIAWYRAGLSERKRGGQ
jgi:nucleoside-diphosphate-sugar epimerase